MALGLKVYQQRGLDSLSTFLRRAAVAGTRVAFIEQTEKPYHEQALPAGLHGLPYVCLRLPTGGGKTLLATHAIGIVGLELLHSDRPTVLWLAPTSAIVEQTLRALKDRAHPYRQVLDERFAGCVEIKTLAEAQYVTRGTLDGATTVIVSTLAALRVEDTDGRKVYEQNGALSHHFTGITNAQASVLEMLDGNGPVHSLANVLRLRRPIVIMDEAHNARTALSFDTLVRFSPSCIIEFTATPDQGEFPSNVLFSASAAELKAEQMVKLPIRLSARSLWKEAVDAAVRKQRELERVATEEERATGEYIRPIVLMQAQSRSATGDTITADVLAQTLREDFSVPANEIVVATSDTGGLPEDILDRACPVRFVITVARLREGWDCPFAYVLCSVSNLTSSAAVEQILGRILRMPSARAKVHDNLNVAYAIATSERFIDAASNLTDALVQSGFERFEARQIVEPELGFPLEMGGLFGAPTTPISEPVLGPMNAAGLPEELRTHLVIEHSDPSTPGAGTLVYHGPPISAEHEAALHGAVTSAADKISVRRLALRSRGRPAHPAALGMKFVVPQLCVRRGDQLEVFEDQFRESPWSLAECDASLTDPDLEFMQRRVMAAEVDVNARGRLEVSAIASVREAVTFNDLRGPGSPAELAVWLDQAISHPDVPASNSTPWFQQVVENLLRRGLALADVITSRFRLREVIEQRIRVCRAAWLSRSYQELLLPEALLRVDVSPDCVFEFTADRYPASKVYQGRIRYERHYYETPGDMNDEEAACAVYIDQHPLVQYWIRNLERRPESFWLQTPSDKFYPDFVAYLRDGRALVVEYKGAHLLTSEDTQEKRRVGEIWEARSGGRCVFRLVGSANMQAALEAIR